GQAGADGTRRASCADDCRSRTFEIEKLLERLHRAHDVSVVATKPAVGNNHRVDCADTLSKRIESVQMINNCDFERNRHAESPQSPVDPLRSRTDKVANELSGTAYFEREKDGVMTERSECSVVNRR